LANKRFLEKKHCTSLRLGRVYR